MVVTSVDGCALPSKRPMGKRLNHSPSMERRGVLLVRRLHVRVVPGLQRVRPLIHGGRSSVWLEHLVVVQEVAGSNPVGHPNIVLHLVGEERGCDDV